MNGESGQPIYTVGHSNVEFSVFVGLLRMHGIQAVADVRSSPYSQFTPQFNREPLRLELQRQGIAYVFLGAELGARRSERECYVNGRADYGLISKTAAFQSGLTRLVRGAAKMRITLMCAEKDPIECHRCILVSPHLTARGLAVFHILSGGTVERHQDTEKRLLQIYKIQGPELFRSDEEIITDAYTIQGEKIAYEETELTMREDQQRYGH